MLHSAHCTGTTTTLIDLLVGGSRIEGRVTIDDSLMKKICACANVNRTMLRVNSNKPPVPASAKKLLLALLGARIIGHNIEENKTHGDSTDDTYGETSKFLAFAAHPDGTNKYASTA